MNLTYPARPGYAVLRGFTMDMVGKEVLGLMGPSGCGKSSVAQLLLRTLTCTGGVLTVDGVTLTDFDRSYAHQVNVFEIPQCRV